MKPEPSCAQALPPSSLHAFHIVEGASRVRCGFIFAAKYAILDALPPLDMAMEGGVSMLMITFILSILAGVIANRISKWFDEREHDGDEPRD